MIVNFIGSPNSGKTTTAAMVFANLKENGITCEFLVEEARLYIAKQKYIRNSQDLVLFDLDQELILEQQLEKLKYFKYSSSSIIILDSSPINSLFYMTKEAREDCNVKQQIEECLSLIDLVFYCPTISTSANTDQNRLHTLKECLEIDKLIPEVLTTYCKGIEEKLIYLDGSAKTRQSLVTGKILDLHVRSFSNV